MTKEDVAGIVYSVLAHLTTLKEPVTFSSAHECGPAVEVAADFLSSKGIGSDTEPNAEWANGFTPDIVCVQCGKAMPYRGPSAEQWCSKDCAVKWSDPDPVTPSPYRG